MSAAPRVDTIVRGGRIVTSTDVFEAAIAITGDKIAAIPEPDSGGDHNEYFEAEVQTPMVVEMKKGGIETAKNVGEQRYYELLIEILK